MAKKYKKCTCCDWRYGEYNMRHFTGGEIVDVFCETCKDNNPFSEDGAYSLKHHKKTKPLPSDPPPQWAKVSNPVQCWCCEYQYKKVAVVKLQYTCSERHSFKFCLNCANKHHACPEDRSQVNQETEANLDDKLDEVKTEDMKPIKPY